MSALEELKVLIVGSASGAVTAFRQAGAEAEGLEAKTAGANAEMRALGTTGSATGSLLKAGIVGGAAVAGAALVKFGLDGVKSFADLTGQTRSLRNVMGGTAEDASRIAGAARGLGLDVDTVSRGFFQLTKRIADNKDTLAQNGIEVVRNKDNSVDMAKTLINVSEGYKAITDPAERNLFLIQNFGRAGAQLIPLLIQGKEKLAAFYAATANHGQVFSEEDLEKGRQYKVAMNELDQAWQGLSSTLGRELIPFVTDFARGLDTVITAIPNLVSGISDFVSGLDPPLVHKYAVAIGEIGDALGLSGDAAKQVGADLGDLKNRFAGLDAKQAAHSFLELNAEALKSSDSVHASKQALIDFASAAQNDIGAAALIIQGLKEMGINTKDYEAILKTVAGQQIANTSATQKQKDAMTLLTGSYDDQIKALDKLNDALDAQYDKDFAAIHAQEGLRDAIDDLNTKRQAAADAGYSDAAANEAASRALVTVEEAAIKAGDAARDKAQADHEGEGASAAAEAGYQAQKKALDEFAQTLAPEDPLRVFLQQYIDKLNDPAVNSNHEAGVDIPGIDDLLTKLNSMKTLLGDLTSTDWQVRVAVDSGAVPVGGFFGPGSNAGV